MRSKGKIRSWQDDRGFGFIQPNEGSKDVFLHISACLNRTRRPVVGEFVTYNLTTDDKGRPRASRVALPGDRVPLPADSRKGNSGALGALAALVFLAAIAAAVLLNGLPTLFLWGYLGMSIITYLSYGFDKIAAKDGNWRTSEEWLHLLAVAGGWPGSLIAQYQFRHKTKKQSFLTVFWITVILNLCLLLWVLGIGG